MHMWLVGWLVGRPCQQERYRRPALALNIDTSGLVLGTVSRCVATVELQLPSGERLSVEPPRHVVLHARTREAMEDGGPELAIGLDQNGQEVGRQRFSP